LIIAKISPERIEEILKEKRRGLVAVSDYDDLVVMYAAATARIAVLEAALTSMPCAPGVWLEDCPRCRVLKK